MNDLTDIESELFQTFKCDVVVENDVNMAVLGEWWKSQYNDKDNIVFINIGEGIGAGIMIDGQLYKGHHGSSGEIGNSVLDFAQMFQNYDDDGAFESLIIGQSARHELTALVQSLHDNAGSDPDLLLRIIYSNKVFIFFCMMLINMTCLLDPDKIILGGEYGLEFARIANLFRMIIEQYAPTGSPAIVGSGLGIDAVLYGAIHSGIDKIKSRIYSDMGDM